MSQESPTVAEQDTASESTNAAKQTKESTAGNTPAAEQNEESAAGSTSAAEQTKESAAVDHETQTPIHSKFILSESSKHGRVTGSVLQQASDQAIEIINKVKKTFNEKNHY